jgi:hypothetical protein
MNMNKLNDVYSITQENSIETSYDIKTISKTTNRALSF